jgi:uncharacterized surface protein with fasciclin (FAS1) repeats
MKMHLTVLAASLFGLSLSAPALASTNCGMKNSHYQAMKAHHPQLYSKMMYAAHYGDTAYGGYYKHKSQGYGTYPMQKTAEHSHNIVEVASSTGSFNTLITAVQAAGLMDTLSGKGPFTVFAPTDEAFAKLPEGTLDALLADKDKLTQVLTYHVVPGRVDAQAVSGVSKLATVQGSELPVDEIKITNTDVNASNGIIHVIDEVLIPDV